MRYFKIVRLGCASSKICDVYIKFYTILKNDWIFVLEILRYFIHNFFNTSIHTYREKKITSPLYYSTVIKFIKSKKTLKAIESKCFYALLIHQLNSVYAFELFSIAYLAFKFHLTGSLEHSLFPTSLCTSFNELVIYFLCNSRLFKSYLYIYFFFK